MTKTINANQNQVVNVIGVVITIIIVLLWIIVAKKQHGYLKKGTERLQILAMRAGSAFPIYAICMMISLLSPVTYAGFQIPVNFMEGYAFYTFWAFITTNLGGPDGAVKKLTQSHKDGNGWFCSSCCCPSDIRTFYSRGLWSEWHFVVTRTLIVILATIFDYASQNPELSVKKAKSLRAIYGILSIIAFFILCNGILTLVNYYENIMKDCSNLKAIMKMMLVKVSTGLMVIQGLIVQLVSAIGKLSIESTGGYNEEDTALRIYAFVLLVEYILLAVVFWFAFSPEMDPPANLPEAESRGSFEIVHMSFWSFLYKIFSFTDVFHTLDLDESLSSQAQLQSSNSV